MFESMDGCGGWGGPFGCHPGAVNFTLTTAEPYVQDWGSTLPLHVYSSEPASHAANIVPVPYMTHQHFTARAYLEQAPSDAAVQAEKSTVVSMAFTEGRNPPVRGALLRQCARHPEQCTSTQHLDSSDLHAYMGLYRPSWFCVMPSGDSPSRAAIYECAALGVSIPVLLDPVLVKMLPFSDVVDWPSIIEVVPSAQLVGNGALDLVQHLHAIPIQDRLAKIRRLQAVRHLFQYSSAPDHSLVRFDTMSSIDSRDDAFTASVKAVLRNACSQGQIQTELCSSSTKLRV